MSHTAPVRPGEVAVLSGAPKRAPSVKAKEETQERVLGKDDDETQKQMSMKQVSYLREFSTTDAKVLTEVSRVAHEWRWRFHTEKGNRGVKQATGPQSTVTELENEHRGSTAD